MLHKEPYDAHRLWQMSDRPLLPLFWGAAFPPIVRRLLSDDRGCNFYLEEVAELPEFLRRARILEQDLIDVERVEFAGAMAIDSLPDTGYELSQLGYVIVPYHQARDSSLMIRGHEFEATQVQLSTADPVAAAHAVCGNSVRYLRRTAALNGGQIGSRHAESNESHRPTSDRSVSLDDPPRVPGGQRSATSDGAEVDRLTDGC